MELTESKNGSSAVVECDDKILKDSTSPENAIGNRDHVIMKSKVGSGKDEMRFSSYEYCCKALATLFALVAFVLHVLRGTREGSDSCTYLLTKGEWRSEMWQPHGCMVHRYNPLEIQQCLKNRPLAVIGDSRVRDIYNLLVHQVRETAEQDGEKKAHWNMTYEEASNNLSIHFFWMPEVNKSMEYLFQHWLQSKVGRPSFIVGGAALWTIKNKVDAIDDYERNLTKVNKLMNELGTVNDGEFQKMLQASKTLKIKVNRDQFPKSPVIVWKMQEPVVELLLSEARKTITIQKITAYNAVAKDVLYNTSVKIFTPSMLVKNDQYSSTVDGLHYLNEVIEMELDILLNVFCNAYIRPADASCCVPREHTTQLQYNSMAVFVACTLLFLVMSLCRRCRSQHVPDKDVERNGESQKSTCAWIYSDNTYSVLKAMAKLTFIMAYFFICDRTSVFMKEQKQYSNTVFLVFIIIFLLLGAFTWTPVKQVSFLNRDQSDEWKGWAQLFILLYHYLGASKVIPIYVFIRLIVASYLFMSSYGHFTYFWKKGDFSLYRVCQVVVRMNIFVVILCLIMARPYQFYYFVPLVTFWFFFLYVVVLFYPTVTAKLAEADTKYLSWMACKLVLFFFTVYLVWSSPLVCRWIFSQWAIKELFVDRSDSVYEWIFRSNLDRYIVPYGLLFAFVYQLAVSHGIIADNNLKRLFPRAVSYLATFISIMAMMGYTIQAFSCRNKVACNTVHSVVSFLPVTAFLLLRNINGYMRSHYSTFYAWVGKISLELFVGQYHIWLAKDTKGILVLIPNQPFINFTVTTFIFVCICHEVSKATGVLTQALVAKDVRVMLRRLVIFIIMLLIIWWHKTHNDKGKLH